MYRFKCQGLDGEPLMLLVADDARLLVAGGAAGVHGRSPVDVRMLQMIAVSQAEIPLVPLLRSDRTARHVEYPLKACVLVPVLGIEYVDNPEVEEKATQPVVDRSTGQVIG